VIQKKSKQIKSTRSLRLKIFLLFGATDTCPPHTGFPGTENEDNIMYSLTPDGKMELTPEQIVREIWVSIIGDVYKIFKNGKGRYSQPKGPGDSEPTKD